MRAFFHSLLGYFLSPFGVFAMGVLDASLVFFLPFGIDFVVIVMAARKPELFWLYAVMAAAGSVAGATVTFWIGHQAGEHGLARLISPSRLERIKKRVSRTAAVSLGALAIIPPPFPFTAFVLTSGAIGVKKANFFGTLAAVRALRFGVEAALAATFGSQILSWMESTVFEVLVGILIALAVVGTIVSAVVLFRASRHERGRTAPAAGS